MKKLIKTIEDGNLDSEFLLKKMNESFDKSYKVNHTLIPKIEKVFKESSKRNKKLFEMGEFCLSNFYYYKIGITFDEFKDTISEDTVISEVLKENIKDIFVMENHKFLYKAYKYVLINKIEMMDYNYCHIKEEWL